MSGSVDPAFGPVRDAFAANFDKGLEVGASLAVSIGDRPVVDLWAGWADAERTRPWERDTLACVFSCTKGVVALCALLLVRRGQLDLDAPVASYWPEFAQADKDTLPVRWLLTHEAGLSAISERLPFGSLSDWELMVDALARQAPAWEPGSAHGYHGVTFGHLVGEVVRRISGRSIGAFLREELAGPLDLDLVIGLAPDDDRRTAEMVAPPPPEPGQTTFFSHFTPGSLGARSFGNPPDCNAIPHTNSRSFRGSEIPAANGHGTARSLAALYGAVPRLLGDELLAEAARIHVDGPDLVMELPTRFGLGFEVTSPDWPFGPGTRTFGHTGSGGSLGILDSDAGLSLGYVMNQMYWGPTRDDPRWAPLFSALYSCL
jgi:CubicO group peptidase (beta-lactamase class C family)